VSKVEQIRKHRNAQIIAALYSILFVVVIGSGYYLLFSKNPFFAALIATVMATIAWFLARLVGNEENGIRRYAPLFVLLLLISAVGVFNSLMLNLEGRRIFAEAISDSVDQYTALQTAAVRARTDRGIGAKIERVAQLQDALIREINNPLNCGQGPEARRLIGALQQELPGFTPLSSPGVDCSKNEQVISDYRERIADLVQGAQWNSPDLGAVLVGSERAKLKLQELSRSSSTMLPPSLLGQIAPELETLDVAYRADRERLARQGVDVSNVPSRLPLSEVESLGEWSQLLNLMIDRLDKLSTYIYIALAFFFDWMMVYLFGLIRSSRPRRSSTLNQSAALQRAW
jgi:hypothetical protein